MKNLKKVTLNYSSTIEDINQLNQGDRVTIEESGKVGGLHSINKNGNLYTITLLSDKGLFFEVVFQRPTPPNDGFKFHRGDRVEVLCGEYMGIQGVVQNVDNKPTVWLDNHSITDHFEFKDTDLKMVRSYAEMMHELNEV